MGKAPSLAKAISPRGEKTHDVEKLCFEIQERSQYFLFQMQNANVYAMYWNTLNMYKNIFLYVVCYYLICSLIHLVAKQDDYGQFKRRYEKC